MSRPKWTEAEAAGAAKEADRRSVTAAAYAKARSELATLFGWNAGALSPDQMLRLDCAVALRLALDDLQGRLIRGEPIDMNRMLTASEALAKLLPPAVLASPPPEHREDPREALLEMILQMRERTELGERSQEPITPTEADVVPPGEIGEFFRGPPKPGPDDHLAPPRTPSVIEGKAAPAAPAYDYDRERGWRDHVLPDGSISPRPFGAGRYWGPV
jgi:hypothetical protein